MADFERNIIVKFSSNIKQAFLAPMEQIKDSTKDFKDKISGNDIKNNIKDMSKEIRSMNKEYKEIQKTNKPIREEYKKQLEEIKKINEELDTMSKTADKLGKIGIDVSSIREQIGGLETTTLDPVRQAAKSSKKSLDREEGLPGQMEALTKDIQDQKTKLSQLAKGWAIFGAAAVGAMAWIMASTPALGAQMEIINVKFSLLGMAIGNELMPILEPFIDMIISIIEWFTELDPWILQIIGTFVLLASGLTILIGVIFAVNAALIILSANPIILIIGAIILAVAIIITLIMRWDEVVVSLRDAFLNGNIVIKILLGLLFALFSPLIIIAGIIKLLIDNWDVLVEGFKDGIASIGQWFVDLGTGIAEVWNGMWDAIGEGWDTFITGMSTKITDFVDGVVIIFTSMKDSISDIFSSISGFFTDVGDSLADWWEDMTLSVTLVGAGIFKKMVGVIAKPFNTLLEGLAKIFDGIADWDIVVGDTEKWLLNRAEGVRGWKIEGFAKGTSGLPSDMVIQAHKGEIIVPAKASEQVRQGNAVIGQGGGGGRNSPAQITNTFHITIQGGNADAQTIADMASEQVIRKMEKLVSRV